MLYYDAVHYLHQMENDIRVIDSTADRAKYLAETLVTRSFLARDAQVNMHLSPDAAIQLEIDESGWENLTVQDVKDVISDIASQVDAVNMENWLVCTYSRLNRDFGIRYESEVDPTSAIDEVDEEPMETTMSMEEVLDFCRSANRGDRCRFLNLDDEESGKGAEQISSVLRQAGINASVIPQVTAQLGNYFIIVVLGGEVVKALLR